MTRLGRCSEPRGRPAGQRRAARRQQVHSRPYGRRRRRQRQRPQPARRPGRLRLAARGTGLSNRSLPPCSPARLEPSMGASLPLSLLALFLALPLSFSPSPSPSGSLQIILCKSFSPSFRPRPDFRPYSSSISESSRANLAADACDGHGRTRDRRSPTRRYPPHNNKAGDPTPSLVLPPHLLARPAVPRRRRPRRRRGAGGPVVLGRPAQPCGGRSAGRPDAGGVPRPLLCGPRAPSRAATAGRGYAGTLA